MHHRVKIHLKVMVKVREVDVKREKKSLSLNKNPLGAGGL
jgi:hypothetical protein